MCERNFAYLYAQVDTLKVSWGTSRRSPLKKALPQDSSIVRIEALGFVASGL